MKPRFLCVLAVVALPLLGCNPSQPGPEGSRAPLECDSSKALEPKVRSLMTAALELSEIVIRARGETIRACAHIALELNGSDTWSALPNQNLQLSNPDRSSACDQALARLRELLPEGRTGPNDIAIGVTKGQCHLDFERQVECDAACARSSCDSGTVSSRCPALELSAFCDTTCEAQAYCAGTLANPTHCFGYCESDCIGKCHGSCFDSVSSQVSLDSESCNGKCSATCEGECRGVCHVFSDDGLTCGPGVRCVGGCAGSYADPACSTGFLPPACEVDPVCHGACSSRVTMSPRCASTTVFVAVNTDVAEQAPIVPALKAHLPALLCVADREGELVQRGGEQLLAAAIELGKFPNDTSAESRACTHAVIENVAISLSDLASVTRATRPRDRHPVG